MSKRRAREQKRSEASNSQVHGTELVLTKSSTKAYAGCGVANWDASAVLTITGAANRSAIAKLGLGTETAGRTAPAARRRRALAAGVVLCLALTAAAHPRGRNTPPACRTHSRSCPAALARRR